MRIPVLFSFARSGGTLVNQILGSHPQCLVLSEVNPAASFKSVSSQACEWLRLIEATEQEQFCKRKYAEQIHLLHVRAQATGKILLVRDWSSVNFMPHCVDYPLVPSNVVEQQLYLEQVGLTLQPWVISRRAEQVYASIRQTFSHLQTLSLDDFASCYLRYARAVQDFPILHLEDIQQNPQKTLAPLLENVGLDSDAMDACVKNFHHFQRCTGNTSLPVARPSASAKSIMHQSQLISTQDSNMSAHPLLQQANMLLSYDE